MKLQTRLGLLLAGLAALSATLVGVAGYQLTALTYRREIQRSLTEYSTLLVSAKPKDLQKLCERKVPKNARKTKSDPVAANSAQQEKLVAPKGAPTGASIQCLGSSGLVTMSPQLLDLPVGSRDVALVTAPRGTLIFRTVTVEGRRYIMTTLATGGGAIQVAREISENARVLSSLVFQFSMLVLAAAALAAIFGVSVARRTVAPLVKLTEAVEAVSADGVQNVSLPVPLRADETGRLTSAFASMMESLRDSEFKQTQLVHDAGHELRSPLTSLRTNIGVLYRHPDMDYERRHLVVDNLHEELAELTGLVDDLISFASGEDGEGPSEVVHFGDVLAEMVHRWHGRGGRNFELAIDSSEPLEIVGHRRMLARMLSNIIENADKFSPPDLPVHIDLRRLRNAAILTVTDHGPGVVPGDLTRIFDRFYRSTIHRDQAGSGLGLSIVLDALDRHGGSVRVQNISSGGAQFVITLPISDTIKQS
jgi:two-component system, OmpR family, sensor histidine kinase MprB